MNKVIVAGGINMDIVVLADRHPRIGESLIGNDVQYFPGGKGANQAVAASRLGADTTMLGMVGQDSDGKKLVKFIESQGVNNAISSTAKAPTGTALITVSLETADNTIVVIPGANLKLSEQDITKVGISKGDILVSQFEIPESTIQFLFKKGRQAGTTNILNPAPAKPVSKEFLDLVDILIVNESELEILSGNIVTVENEASILSAVSNIKGVNQSIVVTLGEKGALSVINGEQIRTGGVQVNAKDTTGAGDCFVGAIAARLANNFTLKEALEFGNLAASISVTKSGAGTSMPTLDEVNSVLNLPQY